DSSNQRRLPVSRRGVVYCLRWPAPHAVERLSDYRPLLNGHKPGWPVLGGFIRFDGLGVGGFKTQIRKVQHAAIPFVSDYRCVRHPPLTATSAGRQTPGFSHGEGPTQEMGRKPSLPTHLGGRQENNRGRAA